MLGTDQMIYVEVSKQSCEVELYINGIPVVRLSTKESKASEPAHQYLIDGANEVELLIYPGQIPSQARTAQRELDAKGAYAVAKLVKYPVGVYPGDVSGEILGIVEWKGQDAKKEMFPKSVFTKLELGPMFGRWQWQDAEQVTLDKKTLAEISGYVEKFYAAFSASNGQEILNLARVRLQELDKAYPGTDPAQENARFLRNVEKRKHNAHWKVPPLRPALFDFRVCANGRMVEIINSDWKPTIRGLFEDRDFEYTYQMFLSKIKGQWVMVR
ncbi:MAG: hypothetical protein HY273_11420 [Gammaproteobacteria bacterium]|nr:hypothetical protein [Gammaproteobacteria bacterium]